MKLLAIRLADVGRFSSPVALEGLSGGLDVLAGPNELGKSTILAALDAVLNQKYDSAHKAVRKLQPYSGGTPTIEIDFEAGGRRHRLRKTFLRSKSAELRDLGGGASLRGEDAEQRLAELFSNARRVGALNLVWVAQGASIDTFEVGDEKTLVPLQTFILEAVEASSDGGALQRLRRRVRLAIEDLETLKTGTPRGAYKEAIEAERKLSSRLQAAEGELATARARLDRLDVLAAELAEISGPAAAARRRELITTTQHALAEARQARDAMSRAVLEEKASHAAAALAVGSRDGLRALIDQRAQVDLDIGAARKDTAARSPRITAARAGIEDLRASSAAARSRVAALHEESAAAKAYEAARRHARAQALADQLRDLDARLAASGATRDRVEAARRAEAEMIAIRAQLDAAAPRVRIEYLPDAVRDISVAGAQVPDGAEIVAREPLAIDIAGIGRIVVTPPAAEPDLLTRLAASTNLRDRQLAAIGAASLGEAEIALEARVAVETERTGIAAELRATAPQGVSALSADASRLAAAPNATAPSRPIADIEAELAQKTGELRHLEASLATADRELTELLRLDMAAQAKLQQLEHTRDELEHKLPPPDEREARLAALDADARSAIERHEEQARALSSWRAVAPDEQKLAALERAAADAAKAENAAMVTTRRLSEEASHIEGALGRDQDEDIESNVKVLGEHHAAARARREDLTAEVAALRLIDRELALSEEGEMGRLLSPVLDRIAPHLHRLFPEASLGMERSYAPSSLTRGGTAEPVERLSSGTREQLAILARLGFARLLADRGAPIPLVLDDALVYADDRRIAAMFDCLAEASRHHQVIVLTCREAAFSPLHGRRLTLEPWR